MDSFMYCALRVGVAQVLQSMNIVSSSRTALNTLTDVVARFITQLGARSTQFCEIVGRTDANEFDIVSALQTMGLSCRALSQFVAGSGQIAFAYQLGDGVRTFRQCIDRQTEETRARYATQMNDIAQTGPAARPSFVPQYLPPFPKEHTYRHTAPLPRAVPDAKRLCNFARQQRSVESTIVSLYGGRTAPAPQQPALLPQPSAAPSISTRDAPPESVRQDIEAHMKKHAGIKRTYSGQEAECITATPAPAASPTPVGTFLSQSK